MEFLRQQRSIRAKLGAILLATTTIGLLCAGIALVLVDLRTQMTTLTRDLSSQADIIGLTSTAALSFDDRKAAQENLRALRTNADVAAAALYDERGQLFAAAVFDRWESGDPPLRALRPSVEFYGHWVKIFRRIELNRAPAGWVYIQARHKLVDRLLEHLAVLIVILAGSLLVASALANRLQRSVSEPVLQMSEAARRIRHGQFDVRPERASEDEIGELVDAFNAMVDELERRSQGLQRANEALRSSEERFQLAVRGASAGLWDWDLAAGTMFYSPRLKEMLGYADAEFPNVPASLLKVAGPEDVERVRSALRAHLREGAPYQLEVPARVRTGETRWFLVAGEAQRDEAGRPVRMAGSVIDITQQKDVEGELRETNRRKDEFLATLAHELRNPLAPLRTGLEILRLDTANGPAAQKARERMERQLQHLIRLVDDLLDLSRVSSGKVRLDFAPMQLRQALEQAVDIARPAIAAAGHHLELDFGREEISLLGDSTRLAQAVGNLLNNAAKYTPPGGHIALRARREGRVATIDVRDDGLGLPADMLESVFSMFTQVSRTLDRSQGGLGIGLSLVRSLVGLHGGTVKAASPGPGQGSTFTIQLPCEPAGTTVRPASSDAGAAPVAARRVLVVDDNVDAAESLASALAMQGHATRMVHDGHAVLPAARAFEPDVVLLDIGLPGTSGYEVARALRADPATAGVLLVAVTGWGTDSDRRRSAEAGFQHHLTKPVDLGTVSKLLACEGDAGGSDHRR